MPSLQTQQTKSEAVTEILGKPPKWLIRWGITVIFLVVAGLFVGSYFFKYPEVLTAKITVTTENLPADIIAKTNAKIDTLFIKEKQTVKKGDLLLILENTANTRNILMLDAVLNKMQALDLHDSPILELGELQPLYNTLQKSLSDYNYFKATDYHNKKIATINKQIEVQKIILNQSNRQLKLQQEQLQLANQQFKRDSILYTQQVIAASEYETAKTIKLQAYQTYENANTAIENQKISILQLEQTIFDLEQQRDEQETQYKLALNTSFDQLKAQLQAFKKLYFIESPSDGVVTFTKFWQKNQNITAGETILTIVPQEEEKITGKIYLPPQGAGKVKVGQTANIKFDNFPYMEYGLIKVQIKNIALVPITEGENKFYVLEVDFPTDTCRDVACHVSDSVPIVPKVPQTLTTNYGKQIIFTQQMSGTAEIITEDLRLIDRFLNPIKSILNK